MSKLINRYCKTRRCDSQYFVEEGADRTDGKTKVFTFKEGIKRIKEIGKDDELYKDRKVKDRGIDGIIDWGYDMYGIFLIDADEKEDWIEEETTYKEYDKSRKFTSASECIDDLMENHKETAYEIADMEEEYKDRNKTSDKEVEEYIYDLFDREPQMYEEICSSK